MSSSIAASRYRYSSKPALRNGIVSDESAGDSVARRPADAGRTTFGDNGREILAAQRVGELLGGRRERVVAVTDFDSRIETGVLVDERVGVAAAT